MSRLISARPKAGVAPQIESIRRCAKNSLQTVRLLYPVALIVCSLTIGLGTAAAEMSSEQPPQFGYDQVVELAKQLAERDYQTPAEPAAALRELSYDDYRKIRFRRDQALWRGEALFQAQFFHSGFLFTAPVSVDEIIGGEAREVRYSRDMFQLDPDVAVKVPLAADYPLAGFKLMYPLHRSDVVDDIAVFLGASYFRLAGRGDNFGLSARGLAVDTAEPSGEEFPYFSKAWLVRPAEKDTAATVYALLDSKSVTGAYRFMIEPGQPTIVYCAATLFFRDKGRKFGFAPLTSMFLQGENSVSRFPDFRPEVHDSDGLMIETGQGERIWRPLENPRDRVRISRFLDMNPRGFGLAQRDQRYENYLDLEARYHRRPTIWIEPAGQWGAGSVELVEIPVDRETNDNIVAYWVPQDKVGDRIELRYKMSTGRAVPAWPTGRVARTLSQRIPPADGAADSEIDTRRFIIDFAGGELGELAANQPVHPEFNMSNGSFSELVAFKDEETHGWRVAFLASRKISQPSDLKLRLTLYGRVISESWAYLWDQQS